MVDYFGLDVGHANIRIAKLVKNGEGLELTALGETKNPASNWEEVGKKGEEMVASAIKLLMSDLKLTTKQVVMSLGVDDVIARMVELPPLKDNEIKDALLFEAETFVPYPMDQVSLDYEVVGNDDGKTQVFVVASKNTVIEQYIQLAKLAGLSPIALEPVPVALKRSMARLADPSKTVLLVDLGEKSTLLTTVYRGNVYMTRALPVGGESLTRAISLSLSLEMPSAEEYKKAYGLDEKQLEGKIKAALLPVTTSIFEEIRKAMVLFKEQYNGNIDLIILSGGGAVLPELATELTKTLGVEAQIAQPFSKIVTSKLTLPFSLESSGNAYAMVIGLALREMV